MNADHADTPLLICPGLPPIAAARAGGLRQDEHVFIVRQSTGGGVVPIRGKVAGCQLERRLRAEQARSATAHVFNATASEPASVAYRFARHIGHGTGRMIVKGAIACWHVDTIAALLERLQEMGASLHRPPR